MKPVAKQSPGWVVVIDGSNLVQSSAWMKRADAITPEALIETLRTWAVRAGAHVHLIFDGNGPLGRGEHVVSTTLVVDGAGPHNGDARVIEVANAAHHRKVRCWVVSDDRTVEAVAGSVVELVIGCASFVARIDALDAAAGVDAVQGESEPASRQTPLGDSVPAHIRDQLERLRRGE